MSDAWNRDGFIELGPLVEGPEELDWLVAAADEAVASGAPNVVQDLVSSGAGPPRVAQVMGPAQLIEGLNEVPAVQRARDQMCARFGPATKTDVGMIITKPALDGGVVPWHQDAVYWDATVRHAAASIWIALQDVDEDNGCLHFVPGSHANPVLEHGPLETDPTAKALQLTPNAVRRHVHGPVAVPLRAGHATLHDAYTLHSSGPNRTKDVRRALVLSVRNAEGNRPI